MELFHKLFSSLLVFVYHCFDRIVIKGYLDSLARPDGVVYFFRNVRGLPLINKAVLSQRTHDYQRWVQGYARNHRIPLEWAPKGVRKQDHVAAALQRMQRADRYGVYFILASMEAGKSYRSTSPRYPTEDPNYRILRRRPNRFTHYYFYLRDPRLGPLVMRVGTFLPFETTYYLNGHSFLEQELNRVGVGFHKQDNAFLSCQDPVALQAAADRLTPALIRQRLDHWSFLLGPKFSARERQAINLQRRYSVAQVEYCRNFVFRRRARLEKMFQRACELGLLRLTANQISQLFGQRLSKRFQGKLHTVLEEIEHGRHALRVFWKNGLLKQYHKFLNLLRQELCANCLPDFGLRKGLQYLGEVRHKFQAITDRFAAFQATCLGAPLEFPLLETLARPVQVGAARFAGLHLDQAPIIRLLEVLLQATATVGGWSAAQIHQAVLTRYRLGQEQFRIPQLRYQLRKLKAHGLLERPEGSYRYRLTEKGAKAALLFVLFHQRLFGPLAYSLFVEQPHHQPTPSSREPTTRPATPSPNSSSSSRPHSPQISYSPAHTPS